MTTTGEMAAKMNEAEAWLPGKRVKLEVTGEGAIMLDGQSGIVSEDDGPADTTLTASPETWRELFEKKTDGMTAFMNGKLRVDGDMSNAMQLQGIFSKLRPD